MNPNDLRRSSALASHDTLSFSTCGVAELLALAEGGRTASLSLPGQGNGRAVTAQATVDLQARATGRQAVAMPPRSVATATKRSHWQTNKPLLEPRTWRGYQSSSEAFG